MEPAERARALADIADEAARLGRLVNDLLTLARADAGQRLALARMPLRPLAEYAIRQVRLLAGGQQVSLLAVDDVVVDANADAVKQLLLILLDNALKYTPADGRVELAVWAADGKAYLAVTDTGTGIASEDLEQVFEPFYRADMSREAAGSGLGLAIARWIAEQHGGRIDATSSPGLGSTFTVSIPLATTGAAPLAAANVQAKPGV